MKIALASDLHLEFGSLDINNTENADVLVLAGDICVAKSFDKKNHAMKDIARCRRFLQFFEHCASQFKHVVYVMGNHEHYHGDYNDTYPLLKQALEHIPNLYLLEKEAKNIDGMLFIGQTLWTNFNSQSPQSMVACEHGMNDYHVISNKPFSRLLKPSHTLEDHIKSLDFIVKTLDENMDNPVVIVSHTAPSIMSIHPMYAHEHLTNGAYFSNLEWLFVKYPNIKLFCHGHVHTPFSYKLSDTMIECWPRGYLGADRGPQDDDPYFPKYIKVE